MNHEQLQWALASRPQRVSDLIGLAFAVFRHNWRRLLVVSFCCQFIWLARTLLPGDLGLVLPPLIATLIWPLELVIFHRLIQDSTRGQRTPWREVWNQSVVLWPTMILALMAASLAVAVGFVLVLPGIYLYLRTCLFPFAAAEGREQPLASIKRSWQLTDGHSWFMARYLFIALLYSFVPLLLLVMPFRSANSFVDPWQIEVLHLFASTIMAAFLITCYAVLFQWLVGAKGHLSKPIADPEMPSVPAPQT